MTFIFKTVCNLHFMPSKHFSRKWTQSSRWSFIGTVLHEFQNSHHPGHTYDYKYCQIILEARKTCHFEKTETVKRFRMVLWILKNLESPNFGIFFTILRNHESCPWCEDAKKLPFKTAKPLKLEGHLETEHQFKCDKCKVGGVMEFDKVASHLNTCRGMSFKVEFKRRRENFFAGIIKGTRNRIFGSSKTK